MCPAFCLADYKVQGSTLKAAVLDLKDDPIRRGQDYYRKYTQHMSSYPDFDRPKDFISYRKLT